IVFALEREHSVLSESDFKVVDQLVAELDKLRKQSPELKIGKIDSYEDGIVGARLTSADQQCTLIQVSLGTPYLAVATLNAVEEARNVVAARLVAAGED